MSADLVLELERILPAPRERVFELFTDPDELARWWGPAGFTLPGIELDLRPGGRYRFAMQPPDADLFHLTGEFREVDPPERLSYTFVWEDPDPDDRETLVTIQFRERGEGTVVEFTQGEFATEARLDLHRNGWGDSFEKLERLLADEGGSSLESDE